MSRINYVGLFYVLEPSTGRTRQPHEGRGSAEVEAARLVKKNPEKTFLVLQVQTAVNVTQPVTYTRLED